MCRRLAAALTGRNPPHAAIATRLPANIKARAGQPHEADRLLDQARDLLAAPDLKNPLEPSLNA